MSLLRRAMERIRPRFDREQIDTIMPIMPPSPRRPMPLPLVPPPARDIRGPFRGLFDSVQRPPIPLRPPSIGGVGGINQPLQPILQQPQPIDVPSLMDPRQPQPNLATGIIDPVSQPIQQLPQGPQPIPQVPQPIPQVPQPLEKMPLPPKRDDFMSIGGPGGGFTDNRVLEQQPFVPPQQPTFTPISERTDIYGTGKEYDPANLPEGYSFNNQGPPRAFAAVMPPAGFVYAYGPDGDRISVPSGAPGAAELREQGAARDQAFRDFQKTNPGQPFFGGLTQPPTVQEPLGEPTITPEPVTTPAPVTPPEPVTPPASTTVAANQPTETMAPANVSNQDPFASSVRQVATGLDPLSEQLLFGLGGKGGFIPGAMRAAEKVFYDEQGNPVVIDEQVAGFSPDQISAIEMQRQSLGLQDPYIQDARSALQASMQAYDPSITGQFFNPFEDQVVKQTIQDVMEQGAKSDIGALAGNIARGGQSAFGSRARLGAAERQEALGRGLSEALGSLRARGFSEAQRAGMGEFARQKAAERAGASGLASLGAQASGASLSDIGALFGMGTQQQAQAQKMLDAQRRNLQQRQMTPLLQYQALAPFVSMAPAGQFQTITDFAPPPSAMQAGLGTGLSAFGALGKLYGGNN